MKLRHVAALALTGWYLILPPLPDLGPDAPLSRLETACPADKRPISQWDVWEAYDTAAECKSALAQAAHNAMQAGAHGKCWDLTPAAAAWGEGRCVATDDPRLKGK